jgi:hypothetical protein
MIIPGAEPAAAPPPPPVARSKPAVKSDVSADDPDDRPRKKGGLFDAVEDDLARKKKRRADDDEDDDLPRGRRRRDDEDDLPRGRRRPVDDDDEDDDVPRARKKGTARSRYDDDDDDEPRPRSKKKRVKRRSSGGSPFGSMGPVGGTLAVGGVLWLICLVLGFVWPAVMIAPMVIGYIIAFVGGIMLLVIAFKDDVVQGLLCLFIPFYSLFYLITHWDDCKHAFFIQLGGIGMIMVSACAGAGIAAAKAEQRQSELNVPTLMIPAGRAA